MNIFTHQNDRIMHNTLKFLESLKDNNNREWFEANKAWYQDARADYEKVLEDFITGLNEIDPLLGKPSVKDCIFRIYRDVRFSPNKQPYKTHFGAYIAKGGRKSEKPGYYLHVEPGNSLVGGGIYMPKPEVLKRIRTEIYFDAPTFRNLVESNLKKHSVTLYEDKISRPPKDFDATFPDIDLLKYKSYFVDKPLSDDEVVSKDFIPKCLAVCKGIVGINHFLNRAFQE